MMQILSRITGAILLNKTTPYEFHLFNEKVTYDKVMGQCARHKGLPVMPKERTLVSHLIAWLANHRIERVWIGLYYKRGNDAWMWVDGENPVSSH